MHGGNSKIFKFLDEVGNTETKMYQIGKYRRKRQPEKLEGKI